MNRQNRKIMRRFGVIAILIVLLMGVLTACGSAAQSAPWARNDKTFADDIVGDDTVHQLKTGEYTTLSNSIIAAYSEDYNSLEKLIIAYRGYNPDDVKDSEINESAEERLARNNGEYCNLDYVKSVLKTVNSKASDSRMTEAELDDVLGRLTVKDVTFLLSAFQSTVSLENDGGILDTILCGIGWFLNWMTTYLGFGNYIVGICEFAILVEILMIPFAIKQQKNSIKQAKLRPKEMAIRNKYKGRNDQKTQQQVQQEIQELYQRENFSPFSGCLPLLIQLPIILALYNIVINPMHYVLGQSSALTTVLSSFVSSAKAAGGLGMTVSARSGSIQLLSMLNGEAAEGLNGFLLFSNSDTAVETVKNLLGQAPNFNIGSINFGFTPSDNIHWVLWLIPVINFATYFVTAKLNRKFMYQAPQAQGNDRQTACSNNMMDISMPLLSTFFTFALPAVVGVYWAFRSWIGFAKTVIMAKAMPLPEFTEEDYKAAAKEMAGKKVVVKSERAGTVRSLHHIDDEDYDDTRERALAKKAAMKENEAREQEKKAEGNPVEAAPMKEEKRREEKKGKKAEKKDAEAAEESKPEETENQDAQTEKKDTQNEDEV